MVFTVSKTPQATSSGKGVFHSLNGRVVAFRGGFLTTVDNFRGTLWPSLAFCEKLFSRIFTMIGSVFWMFVFFNDISIDVCGVFWHFHGDMCCVLPGLRNILVVANAFADVCNIFLVFAIFGDVLLLGDVLGAC